MFVRARLRHLRLCGCVSVEVVTDVVFETSGMDCLILWAKVLWFCEKVSNYLLSNTLSYLRRRESSRACLFSTVIGTNYAFVVYRCLCIASNTADDIVYVRDSWLGVWWKLVGMLKSCMLWKTVRFWAIWILSTHSYLKFLRFSSLLPSLPWLDLPSGHSLQLFQLIILTTFMVHKHIFVFILWIHKLFRTVRCGINHEIHLMHRGYFLSLSWALQVSWDVMVDASFPRDKAAMLWSVIEDTLSTMWVLKFSTNVGATSKL